MGNFEDTKPKKPEEDLKYAMACLDEALFRFVCFTDSFKRYMKKSGLLDEN